MSIAQFQIDQRLNAKNKLKKLFNNIENINTIHYSCESFYNRLDGTSPQIASIAIYNFESAQSVSFSIHQYAERMGIGLEEITPKYDEIEKEMLSDYFNYIGERKTTKWLHWDMQDTNYGFLALEHPYRTLGGIPISLDNDNLYNIADILKTIYGDKYIEDPCLQNIVEMNKDRISNKNMLTGGNEAIAFTEKRYVELHLSTLRKVKIISNLARLAYTNELKTNATLYSMYGKNLRAWIDYITEHSIYKIAGAIGVIYTIYNLIDFIF